jgi:hypothetical protein
MSNDHIYAQMPYVPINQVVYEEASMNLLRVDLSPIYAGNALDAVGEKYCATDACEVQQVVLASG